MKKYRMPFAALTVIFCLMLLSLGINAQQSPGKDKDKGKRHERRTESMKSELSLTEEQASKVTAINEKYAEEKRAVRQEMMQKMKAIQEQQEKEYAAVLSDEQMMKYQENQEERRKKFKSGNKGHHKGCK